MTVGGVCVLVPTRNESRNVVPLLERLVPVVARVGGEVLFVDDSDDDTPDVVRMAARQAAVPVRVLHRTRPMRTGGLGGAVRDGLGVTAAPWAVVMDGDLQHPPEVIADIVATIATGETDVVVASRYCGTGSAAGLSSRFRGLVSGGATGLAKFLFPRALAGVTDPMSGFFAVRVAALDVAALRPRGFKILLEMLGRHPWLRPAEVPFTFAPRHEEDSKASWREAARYVRQLVSLRVATLPGLARLARFALTGASGVAVNLAVLALLLHVGLGQDAVLRAAAETAATGVAILWNLGLTELWVFPGRRGSRRWSRWSGFVSLSVASLAVQLPLAELVSRWSGLPYVAATAVALGILVVVRYLVCARFLYRPAEATGTPASATPLLAEETAA